MFSMLWSHVISRQYVERVGRLLLLLGLCSHLTALVTFERTYGGADSEEGVEVEQTMDGGYIITGSTRSFGAGEYDVYLIKTDSLGDTLWTKTYGGTNWDKGQSVQQTLDGGYIITGWTQSFGSGVVDAYLIKTDTLGDTLWTKVYGGPNIDEGYSVRQTMDGGYIITGRTTSYGAGDYDVYLLKTNASGDTIWTRTYGGTFPDMGLSVQQTMDEGFIIVGGTSSFGAGGDEVYVIKTDSLGDTLWTRAQGGTLNDRGFSVQETQAGEYIIAGVTGSFGAGGSDIYLIKMDTVGDTLWTRTYGGSSGDVGHSVHETQDGGYVIAGHGDSFGAGALDVYMIKTDSLGDTLWIRTYGGATIDWGRSIQQTQDGGYIVVGYTDSFGAGSYDVYVIKTDQNGMVGVEEETVIRPIEEHDNFATTIISGPLLLPEGKKCRVFDITGRIVVPENMKPGIHFIEIDGEITQKVIKIR